MLNVCDPCLNCFREIPSHAVFSTASHCNFRPEVANGVISGAAVDYVRRDFIVKLGDSRSNSFRDIREAIFVSNERISSHCHSPNNKSNSYRQNY